MLRNLIGKGSHVAQNAVTTLQILRHAVNKTEPCLRHYSSEKINKEEVPPPGQVFKHERHNMYICWHPEVPFPYEMTKPIDLNAPITESNMKIQALTPVREAFRKKSEKLMISELIKLTYATKHRFYGQFGKGRRAKLRELDPNKQRRNREYL